MDEIKIPMSRPSIDFETQNSMFDVIKSGWISQGKKTQEFESDLSEYLSSKVVVVNNGTSALTAALSAHGIKPGDKVVVPSFTFIATSSAAKILGANILVADVDAETLNISPDSIEKIVKEHNDVKAVIIVDIAGQPVDLEPIIELSKRYNFILIEDAAQAIGSEYKNKKIGSFKHTSCFSFTIAKIMTTIEGGCITTQDEQIHKKLNRIRDVGRDGPGQYIHHLISGNYRFTDIQADLGINQLKQIIQNDFDPDLTFLLDAPIDVIKSRRKLNPSDRFESEDNDFFNRVRKGYLEIADRFSERVKVIDASLPIQDVQAQILKYLKELVKDSDN